MDQLFSACEDWIYLHFNNMEVFSVLDIAISVKSTEVIKLCKWYLCVHSELMVFPQFQKLDDELRQDIEENSWPGKQYKAMYEKYERDSAIYRKKLKKDDNNCVLQ
eukprot:TRINITY_DN8889_c0_g1_i1.p1 TRINITY_DN8889_c0_g1~~TRINITY_DN8889_c0_g1_i1.p1  ORF type:complete len:106 (-),score=16.09 TRINITY_DN8889_c0_g1_i1:76-393(-)